MPRLAVNRIDPAGDVHAHKPLPSRKSPSHPLLKAFAQAEYGHLTVRTPEGLSYHFEGRKNGPVADLQLHSWKTLDWLLARGEIGFAEAYMDKMWDSANLPSLLSYGLVNADSLERYFYGRPVYALWVRVVSMLRSNSIGGSRRNIKQHYDLGNAFYALWLDKSMTYSCGLFGGDRSLTLEEAQAAKYRRILDKLEAKAGDHILEIGCGWGGFAETAARRCIRVTAITVSQEQADYAQARMHDAGLDGLVSICLTDYRKIEGVFDHVVSIGMFEHVGEQYWPTYFQTVKARLKPGGKAMVQSITIDAGVFERTHGKNGFIETYIFPGGVLPSKPVFRKAAEKAGLQCREMFAFGHDYSITTGKWLERFNAREKEVRLMGYDESFLRMWRMYLSCCMAAFDTERTEVMQAELTHGGL
jgi:cyclopropane-fatty-acyl-phospholipid synthase